MSVVSHGGGGEAFAPTQAAKRIKRSMRGCGQRLRYAHEHGSLAEEVAATAETARPKLRRLSAFANFVQLVSTRKFQFLRARATCSESATWPATVAYPPASVVSTQPAVRTQ